MSTKLTTGKVRLSFVNIFSPRAIGDSEPKYSVTLLIPKSDTATVNKIKEAFKEARENFCARNGSNALPLNPTTTLQDGDGTRQSGDPFGPECKGHYVMTVSSNQRPIVVDLARNEILDPAEVYSGCYGRASINCFGYNSHGKKGLSAGLLAIQKVADGEPFGTVGSASDFDDGYEDDEDVL